MVLIRTEATTTLTSTELALRSGDRQTLVWMHSCLVQVWISYNRSSKIFNHFCPCIGTGGTISGTGQFLKTMNEDVKIVLADPEGSGLYNKVRLVFSLF